ncbi:MAG TPA: A/G-specific adenine glycosylase [Gemmataceae bacterium]|nr:A/G-specific adenine glycosylase [Gemmataceae bacterium]
MKPTPHDGPTQNSKLKTRNSRLRRRLLAWFDAARRDLPWRRDRDPYRIWVSEVMLQQTTVAAVVPYFERFLRAFPSLRDLAAAAEQDVLRLWEGLGYYRRARDLHRAARQLVTTHGGTIPDAPEALGELPGLGRYTVGAILSQAFDRRLPVLEANSLRVLCRLFGRADDPRRGPARRWLWQAAEDLLPHRRVGDFNQALMELGALVCTPTAPRCEACPLADDCVARRLGRQDEIPAKAPPPAITEVREAAVVVRRGADVLLAQRPESASRWANLWEFPHGPVGDRESHEAAALRLARELAGLDVALGPELLTLRHGVTRYRITMVCFEAGYAGGEFRSDFYRQGRWLAPGRLADYPVSAPQRRLANVLTAPQRQRNLF